MPRRKKKSRRSRRRGGGIRQIVNIAFGVPSGTGISSIEDRAPGVYRTHHSSSVTVQEYLRGVNAGVQLGRTYSVGVVGGGRMEAASSFQKFQTPSPQLIQQDRVSQKSGPPPLPPGPPLPDLRAFGNTPARTDYKILMDFLERDPPDPEVARSELRSREDVSRALFRGVAPNPWDSDADPYEGEFHDPNPESEDWSTLGSWGEEDVKKPYEENP